MLNNRRDSVYGSRNEKTERTADQEQCCALRRGFIVIKRDETVEQRKHRHTAHLRDQPGCQQVFPPEHSPQETGQQRVERVKCSVAWTVPITVLCNTNIPDDVIAQKRQQQHPLQPRPQRRRRGPDRDRGFFQPLRVDR
jgi:hypothetical protein